MFSISLHHYRAKIHEAKKYDKFPVINGVTKVAAIADRPHSNDNGSKNDLKSRKESEKNIVPEKNKAESASVISEDNIPKKPTEIKKINQNHDKRENEFVKFLDIFEKDTCEGIHLDYLSTKLKEYFENVKGERSFDDFINYNDKKKYYFSLYKKNNKDKKDVEYFHVKDSKLIKIYTMPHSVFIEMNQFDDSVNKISIKMSKKAETLLEDVL